MYPVTSTVAEQFKQNALQYLSILVNPVTGSSFEMTEADVLSNGLNINRYTASGESISLGSCVAAELTLTIENYDGRFDSVQFEGAQLTVSVGTQGDNNISWIPLGLFTVDKAPRRLAILNITALDNMVLFDKEVNRSIFTLPMNCKGIVTNICRECNVILETDLDILPNHTHLISEIAEQDNLTYRQILQWCCEIMGVCGYIDWQGHLVFGWYEKSGIPTVETGSGVVSFEPHTETALTSLEEPVKCIQDLNGYEYPWAGGCGKNLWSAEATFSKDNTSTYTGKTITALPAGTYTISGLFTTDNPNNKVRFSFRTTSPVNVSIDANTGGRTSATFTLEESCTTIRVYGQDDTTNTYSATYTDVQIEAGSTPTDFAPYANICPIISQVNKNLYNKANGVESFFSNTSNVIATSTTAKSIVVPCEPNTTYTISKTMGKRFQVCYTNTTPDIGVATYGKVSSDTAWRIVITTGNNATHLVAYIYLTNTDTISLDDMLDSIQVERGDYKTLYQDYRSVSTYTRGKNLLVYPYYSNSKTDNGVTFTVNDDGSVTLQGATTTSTASIMLEGKVRDRSWFQLIDGQTVTLSGGISSAIRTQFYSSEQTVHDDGDGVTFVADSSLTSWNIAIRVATNTDISTPVTIYPQLELGSEKTAFEPYQSVMYSNHDYNMWDEEWELGNISTTTGQNTDSTSMIRGKNYISIKPNTSYFVYVGGSQNVQVFYYDATKTYLSYVNSIAYNTAFTTPANAYYMRFRMSSNYGTTYNGDISFNYSDPRQIGYGGTLDTVSGLLTVTHNIADMGDLTWTYYTDSTVPMFYADLPNGKPNDTTSGTAYIDICSAYKKLINTVVTAGAFTSADNGAFAQNKRSQSCRILVTNFAYTDAASFKSAMTGQTVVYELATPVTYQLTPAQVETLKSQTNIILPYGGEASVSYPQIVSISLADRYKSDIYENLVEITGIDVKGKENEALYGTDAYALNIENNGLLTDSALSGIANGLSSRVGFKYHPFSASVLPMPYLYPMDIVAVEYRGAWYDCAITEVSFTCSAPTDLKGTGESAQSRSYAQINPLTSREQAIINNLKAEINTTLNAAVNNALDFNQIISNALGLFSTDVPDGSGGTVRYLHDGETLETSSYIVTMTAGGFAWTNTGWNGGSPVWSYGVTSGGFALFKRLSAEGIDVTKASSDYRAEVTPEHFNIYYLNELIITIDATDRAIKTPRLTVPYSTTTNNMLRIGNLIITPTANGANATILEE